MDRIVKGLQAAVLEVQGHQSFGQQLVQLGVPRLLEGQPVDRVLVRRNFKFERLCFRILLQIILNLFCLLIKTAMQ